MEEIKGVKKSIKKIKELIRRPSVQQLEILHKWKLMDVVEEEGLGYGPKQRRL